MKLLVPIAAVVGALFLFAGCDESAADPKQTAIVKKTMTKIVPLHQKMGPAQPGDWLLTHREPGQTFQQYLAENPVLPRGKRKVLYIQPIGEFTATQRKVVTLTADFLGRYFNLSVQTEEDLPLSVIPEKARRVHPTWGDHQILSTYVLDGLLKPRLPDDAAACLALTASDLWPGDNWNFVFGQASLRDRVGVWSIYRNGDPDKDEASFRLCLLRTLKTASHETGHMFSMKHCIAYECNMCGSNNRSESDRRPLLLCPECMAKVCWGTRADPLSRYQRLAEFCKANGLEKEQAMYERAIAALQDE